MRLVGLLLLALLLASFDASAVYQTIRDADFRWIVVSTALIVPLIYLKTLRWQGVLRAQSVALPVWPA